MTLSITTLSMNDAQLSSNECHYDECRVFYCYAECIRLCDVMPSVIRLSVIMMTIVMLSDDMLSVMAPVSGP